MGQTVKIIHWCDVCSHQSGGEDFTDAVWSSRVTIGAERLNDREIDLCEAHRDELVGPLVAAIHTVSRKRTAAPIVANGVPAPPADDAEIDRTCPHCGFVSKSRGALGSHLKRAHGQTIMQAFGRTKAREAGDASSPPPPCPICGQTFTAPQGLSSHMRIKHEISTREQGMPSAS